MKENSGTLLLLSDVFGREQMGGVWDIYLEISETLG